MYTSPPLGFAGGRVVIPSSGGFSRRFTIFVRGRTATDTCSAVRQDVPPSNPASHPPRSLPGRRARPGRRNRPVLPAAERPAHIWPRNCAPLFQNGKMRCPQKPGGLKRMRGAAPGGPLSPRQRPCRAAPPAAPLPQTTPPATSSGRSRPRPHRRLPHRPPELCSGLFDRAAV